MDAASEAILSLQPVTFRTRRSNDADRIPQFGLVAEEVGKVAPDLVTQDSQGEPYAVRYEALDAMLLNEFRKDHDRVEEQQKQITQLQESIAELKAIVVRLNDRTQ